MILKVPECLANHRYLPLITDTEPTSSVEVELERERRSSLNKPAQCHPWRGHKSQRDARQATISRWV